MRLEIRDHGQPLTPAESRAVLELAARAETEDGSAPLSEQFRLSVESRDTDVTHLLSYAAGSALVGYAQARSASGDEPASAELVVSPEARHQGVGTALLTGLPGAARVWSHATGRAAAAAAAFARARRLHPVRALHVMGRSLVDGPPWPPATVPDRYAVRHFETGRDEDAWVEVNAAAFAAHPEQGSLTRRDLEQRMAQPWWNPEGLILIVEADDPDTIAAFHWTKVDPPDGPTGEVYVVGVSPGRQGEGLGRAVTILGLDHLRARGLRDVVLYVDEDNAAAVHTYAALGFTDREVHRQYSRAST
ncbi:mycothiol synthase [Intrasporangium sp. DVR]|uniref:mycothiol synthase n=1 Tax=Intrasporangium sp. DVR TaxID=3127867 RepID=UPI00313A5676